MDFDIRGPESADFDGWRRLYEGYATFYKMPATPAVIQTVWGWLLDPDHALDALLAVRGGSVIGLAHMREMPRPLTGSRAGFLDDLFVDPAVRGGGVADALLAALRAHGAARGWTLIRWLTADDNYRARAVYDRNAKRTHWITYQMEIPPG